MTLELQNKSRKGVKLGRKLNKFNQNPYPTQFKNNFNMQMNKEGSRNYKHSKCSSEGVTQPNNFKNYTNEEADHVYSNRRGLLLNNFGQNHHVQIGQEANENDHNYVIFPKDFHTAKFSQSPFLNKLTSLKAKGKRKIPPSKTYIKGHKSRNSMFPKSYTYQRREPDIYINPKLQLRHGSIEKVEEENKFRNIDDTKSSNPYTNINPYENDQNNLRTNFNVKECDNHKIQVDSDKKRAPTVI